MRLPEDDETYLAGKEYDWEMLPEGSDGCLVIKNFPVSGELFDHTATDLMIRIPSSYPNAALDMFYVDPPLKLKATNAYPRAAEQFEDHAGRRWQRFSRHFEGKWKVGTDCVASFLSLIRSELHPPN